MSRSRTRWLGLAVRARQWALDEHSHALQQARAAEDAARRSHAAATDALGTAHEQRHGLTARHSFGADDLLRHAAHELQLRGQSQRTLQQFEATASHSDAIRADMQQTLAQRDAYQHRLQRMSQQAAQQDARADERELDELWLLKPDRRSHED